MLIWWPERTSDPPAIVLDEQGRFLMWGEDTPLAIKIICKLWIVNVVVPLPTQAIMQFVSLPVSWASKEFFHVRMLTARHLFVFDGIFA